MDGMGNEVLSHQLPPAVSCPLNGHLHGMFSYMLIGGNTLCKLDSILNIVNIWRDTVHSSNTSDILMSFHVSPQEVFNLVQLSYLASFVYFCLIIIYPKNIKIHFNVSFRVLFILDFFNIFKYSLLAFERIKQFSLIYKPLRGIWHTFNSSLWAYMCITCRILGFLKNHQEAETFLNKEN